MNQYDDIINLAHYELKYHKRMSMASRAAQFAPFAALTGYSDAINEMARLTYKKHELDEDTKNYINEVLNDIENIIKTKPIVKIKYFVPDKAKDGGSYISYLSRVKKIDYINGYIVLIDEQKILFDNIINLELVKNSNDIK